MILSGLIRKDFGFTGVLLSDDVSMNALSGTIGERAAKVIAAGCDIALHCNGNMDEMRQIAEQTGPLSEDTAARLVRGEVQRRKAQFDTPFNANDALARLKGLTGGRI